MKHIFIIFLLLIAFQQGCAKTITVGKNEVVTSLKRAVELAANGDTILLHKGWYREGNIVIKKSIRLIGINNPVLDGEDKYEILTVSGEGIVIKGITFRNSGYSSMYDFSSINVVDASYVVVENNVIEESYFAIHFANSSYSIVRNNTIAAAHTSEQTAGNGIHLWKCDNMLVENNNVRGHRDGIYFEFVTNSIIQHNFSSNNVRYGLHFMFSNDDAYLENIFKDNGAGVAVMYSKRVLMQRNEFDHNWGPNAYGLLLKEISDASILENHFKENTVGILMESTNRILVGRNSFQSSGWAMRVQASCNENTFQNNNFYGNTFDVATNGEVMLNAFVNNYWDKYEGYDRNRDVIGDIPYHPVSMYSMVIEQNPNSLMLLRSFMVSLLDKAEKAIPSFTPENLVDKQPLMEPIKL